MSDFAKDRLNICNQCEFQIEGFCALCSCELKIKVTLPEETCPAQPAHWVSQSKQVSQVINHPTAGCVPCRSRGNKK